MVEPSQQQRLFWLTLDVSTFPKVYAKVFMFRSRDDAVELVVKRRKFAYISL